jgi:hypothetical protein
MNVSDFEKILTKQIIHCNDTLSVKANEYATIDRLHNFKVAAELEGCSVRQALAGMMAKHTVSIYDMCKNPETCSMDIWNEKITDHINYLVLLRAVVEEEQHE